MSHLSRVERERRLERIRGKSRGSRRGPAVRRAAAGPTWGRLTDEQQLELERYARHAGRDWRTDLFADCLRGFSRRRARFDVLCPMVAQHGTRWLRALRVPWEGRRG